MKKKQILGKREMIVNYNIKRHDFAFLFWDERSNM